MSQIYPFENMSKENILKIFNAGIHSDKEYMIYSSKIIIKVIRHLFPSMTWISVKTKTNEKGFVQDSAMVFFLNKKNKYINK